MLTSHRINDNPMSRHFCLFNKAPNLTFHSTNSSISPQTDLYQSNEFARRLA